MSEPGEGDPAGTGRCALCRREVRILTRHHLIPRSRRDARQRRSDPMRAEAERATVDLCRSCHHHLHRCLPERDLARFYTSLAAVAAHPDVARFSAWIARRPDGVSIPLAAKKRR
jgi:hypothetical protein